MLTGPVIPSERRSRDEESLKGLVESARKGGKEERAMKNTVYLGLGSNVGDRLANLQAALECLPPAVEILHQSPVYETAPWGYTQQADFLNLVVEGATEMEPLDLLYRVKACERDVGRRATFRYGPREIDIDILLYGDQVVDEIALKIPHPFLAQRAFTLRPLADLAPDLVIPPGDKTVAEHLAALDQSGLRPYHPKAADEI